MATCGRLDHIFEKPLPENPTLLESLSSWKQIKSMKPIDDSSFTEIFGELHFKEKSHAGKDDPHRDKHENKILTSSYHYPFNQTKQYYKNSDSLSLCTEGLGFESSDDVDDLLSNDHTCRNDHQQHEDRKRGISSTDFLYRQQWIQPGVCFKSYRQDGRFILKEIRIPTQEVLHVCRENGRLRLQLIQSDDEILDDDDEESMPMKNKRMQKPATAVLDFIFLSV
ncbi:uncharacterized protein [Primulina huaijiensis]|uniref:uncharacterized protein n=1 Tax=Primulina huaijiensis TaxID=1492673 RepID=UPI003CC70124